MRKCALTFMLLLASAGSVFGDSQGIELRASPALHVPLGPVLENGTQFYSPGYGAATAARFPIPFLPRFFTSLHFDADVIPIQASSDTLTLLSFGPGLGYALPLSARLGLEAGAYGGLYIGSIKAGSVRNPFAAGSLRLEYRLSPTVPLSLGASYRVHLTPGDPVFSGLSVTLGAAYRFGQNARSLELRSIPEIEPVFPLFYTYYDTHPIGTITVFNELDTEVKEVKIAFFSGQYMESPKESAVIRSIGPGGKREIPLYALFNDSIMEITEATKVSGEITAEFTYLGRTYSQRSPVAVRIQDRNAMTWDDDRKAAAFVTAKDPMVQSFAKHAAAVVRRSGDPTVNETFRTAIGMFEALASHGMAYVVDPSSPYEELSSRSDAVDYLQFPNQSLVYRAGDCDDLSILYAALLESVGIETAFITVPGHIYLACNLQMPEHTAVKTFLNPDDLIFLDGETWLPIEVTLVGEGFGRAWFEGAKQWREHHPAGRAGFIPVRQAWSDYEPVGFREEGAVISLPDEKSVAELYLRELRRFSTRQIEPRATEIKRKIRSSGSAPLYINKLGVLYARFGMLEQAREQFERALRRSSYLPSILNLGNIEIIRGNYTEALRLYRMAIEVQPKHPSALAGFARVSYELERYADARDALDVLEDVSPETAERYAFFRTEESAGRAAARSTKEAHEWSEE